MVAAERMKLAETEEELKEANAEKEALRSALRLVERQRKEAESRSASPLPGHEFQASHSHKRSSSSAIAIKSLPPSQPSSAPSSTQIAGTTDEAELQLRAEVYRRLHPRAYLERFLAEGVRPDGRTALDFRDVSINAGA